MSQFSVSIVSYNDFDEALNAAESVLRFAPQAKLFLVDNASADGTGKRLEAALGQKATVLCLPENIGFGKGHNSVIPYLSEAYHFVLNPDVEVKSAVLQELVAWMDEHPDVVMATPQLYFPAGGRQDLPRRAPNFLGLLSRQIPNFAPLQKYGVHYIMADEDLSKVQDIQFCTGSFFCIRTSVFREMGGFDPGYFMYVEDADITRKAMKYGRVCLVPQFSAVHAWHRNPTRDAGHFTMQLKSMFRYFGRWGFRWK